MPVIARRLGSSTSIGSPRIARRLGSAPPPTTFGQDVESSINRVPGQLRGIGDTFQSWVGDPLRNLFGRDTGLATAQGFNEGAVQGAKDFGSGVKEAGTDLLDFGKEIGGAALDVGKHLINPATTIPTIAGGVRGMIEGPGQLYEGLKHIPEGLSEAAEGRSFSNLVGRGIGELGLLELGGAGVRAGRAGASAVRGATAGGRAAARAAEATKASRVLKLPAVTATAQEAEAAKIAQLSRPGAVQEAADRLAVRRVPEAPAPPRTIRATPLEPAPPGEALRLAKARQPLLETAEAPLAASEALPAAPRTLPPPAPVTAPAAPAAAGAGVESFGLDSRISGLPPRRAGVRGAPPDAVQGRRVNDFERFGLPKQNVDPKGFELIRAKQIAKREADLAAAAQAVPEAVAEAVPKAEELATPLTKAGKISVLESPTPTESLAIPSSAAGQTADALKIPRSAGRITGVKPRIVEELRTLGGATRAARELGMGGKAGKQAVEVVAGPAKTPIPLESVTDILRAEGVEGLLAKQAGVKGAKSTQSVAGRAIREGIGDEAGQMSIGAVTKVGGALLGAGFGATLGKTPEERAGVAVMLGLLGLAGATAFTRMGATVGGRAAAKSVYEGLNSARIEMFLSGMAPVKNVATSIGAPITASIESRSLKPIKEALRVPTNLKNFAQEYKRGQFDIGVEGVGKSRKVPRPFSRLIQGIDYQSFQAMKRTGLLNDTQINRLLVRLPFEETVGVNTKLGKVLRTPFGRFMVPFQRTPFSTFTSGIENLAELAGQGPVTGAIGNPGTRRALTAASIAGGGVAGEMTKSSQQQLPILGILAALAGDRAIPFLMGAAIRGGPRALQGGSPLPEFGLNPAGFFPTGPEDIAGVRVVRRLQGKQ